MQLDTLDHGQTGRISVNTEEFRQLEKLVKNIRDVIDKKEKGQSFTGINWLSGEFPHREGSKTLQFFWNHPLPNDPR